MKPSKIEHEGHPIEIRERDGKTELLIDKIPVRYGVMHNGMYFLHQYAYDHTDDLKELARRYVDYRHLTERIRREHDCDKGGK